LNTNENYVKIFFPLTSDEEGYPPVNVESVWAIKQQDGFFQIDNIPFYIHSLSTGDVVSAEFSEERNYFSKLIYSSKNSTLRVVVYDIEITQQIRDQLTDIGCSSEQSNLKGFFAVNVPPQVRYSEVLKLLTPYKEKEKLDYEESALRHD
jgi:hypothetical protein